MLRCILDDEILELFRNPLEKIEPLETLNKEFTIPLSHTRSHSTNASILELEFVIDGKKPERRAAIPDTFESRTSFQQFWRIALQEEMQIKVDSLSSRIYSVLTNQPIITRQDQFSHSLKSSGIEYYENCKLEVFKKGKTGEDCVFLTIPGLTPHTRKNLRKGDVWIVSSDPEFLYNASSAVRRLTVDKVHGPWTVLFSSLWHRPTKEGKIRTRALFKTLHNTFLKHPVLYAIRGPFLEVEILLWDVLEEINEVSDALMDCLINYSIPVDQPRRLGSTLVDQIGSDFQLNEQQLEVLIRVSNWTSDPEPDPPICLIHGPFGTGKSSLLVAIIHLLSNSVHGLRVLVCAHTNIAVDRILQGLQNSGVHDFVRIGSMQKIAKSLLSHSFHAADHDESNSKQKLHIANSDAILRTQIDSLIECQNERKKERLKNASIVGVTCCSVVNGFLTDQQFDVVILDESSQIIEPLALLPLIKSKAKFLIAAGDPCQLPPMISSPLSHTFGLGRTMFSRLQVIGHISHFLKVQYRCHPHLCEIANRHFYDNRLESGCTSKERSSSISGFPTISHFQVEGKSHLDSKTRSRYNIQEANAVVALLQHFKKCEIGVDQVGVICFFRAQVRCCYWNVKM
eukprot:g7473.t1